MIDRRLVLWVWLILQAAKVLAIVQQNCTIRQYSKHYVCGKPGSLLQPSPVGPSFPVENFETCRDLAIISSDSSGDYHLSFDAVKSLCQIYDQHISQQGFVKNKKSNVRFYDTNCFLHCRYPCPPPLNTNLLFNGGFEIPNESHPPWLPFYEHNIVTPGLDSAQAYSLGSSFQGIYQNVFGCVNQLYKVSMYYKTEGVPDLDYYLSRLEESSFYTLGPTGGKWLLFEDFSYVPGPGTSRPEELYLSLYAVSSDNDTSLLVDGVRVEAVDGAAAIVPKPGSQSLFTNGGFESGVTAPWTIENYGRYPGRTKLISPGLTPTTGSSDSAYALRLIGNYSAFPTFDVSQHVTTIPGTHYIFSFDYVVELRGQDLRGSSSAYVYLDAFTNQDFGSLKEIDFEKNLIHNGRFRYVLPLIARDTNITVGLVFNSEDGTSMIVDNFEFVEAA